MKTIFIFFWNLIMGIKQAFIKQFDKSNACLILADSFLAPVHGKQRATAAMPNGQKLPYNKLQPSFLFQKDPENNPRAEWQISCDNSRILFQSSA